MKKYILLLSSLFITSIFIAQVDVNLNFNHLLGDIAFELETPVTVDNNYDLEVSRLEYYISEISITHDGGQVTEIEDLYLLVNADTESVYPLGNFDIISVENVTFGFGVDSSVNNEDPATYPSDHPLAYQSPSMHWGWSSGYRFICIEGNAGFGLLYNYQIHALGNSNYGYVSLNYNNTEAVSGVLNIDIDADYTQLFYDNSVQGGAIIHSDTHIQAVQTLYNARNRVFNSEGGIVTIDEIKADATFSIYPNPVVGNTLNFQLDHWKTNGLIATVLDISGKELLSEEINMNELNLDISSLVSGVYLLKLEDNNGRSFIEKFQK